MRTWIVGGLALLLVVGVLPVQAVEPLSLYDNFNTPLINYNKWMGSSRDTLETYKYIGFPVAGDGELLMDARGWGFRTNAGAGAARVFNRLTFNRLNQNAVRAMKATVKVNSAVAVDCPTEGAEVTQARFRFQGYFFNDGTGVPGRAVGDVAAAIEIRRLSNSTVANQLNVRATAFRCLDADCNITQTLYNQTAGTILVGQTATLLLQWDPATNRFLFQLNANPVMSYTYPLADSAPPQNSFDSKKHIEVHHYIPHCMAVQTQAFMSVNVDDVYVNTPAALGAAATEETEAPSEPVE